MSTEKDHFKSNSHQICYVIVGGREPLTEQALFLSRSILLNDPFAKILLFIPEDEKEKVSKSNIKKISKITNIIYGKKPIPEYPISAKIAALINASTCVSDREYILYMDTDMVMIDSIDAIFKNNFNLYLKPVDIGRQYWGKKISKKDWENLYNKVGFEFPKHKIKSTVDKVKIYPYWNSGFILTHDKKLGEKWLSVLKNILEYASFEEKKWYYLDQVALAILSTQYRVKKLDEIYNYPLHLRLTIPSNVKIIHYHRYYHLAKVLLFSKNNRAKSIINKIGIVGNVPKMNPMTVLMKHMIYRLKTLMI